MSDNEQEGYRRNFWEERQARESGEWGESDAPAEKVYVMNLDRKILLERLLSTQDWVDADIEVADPYTFAYCAQAGWLERRRRNGQLQFRITDDGIGALAANK